MSESNQRITFNRDVPSEGMVFVAGRTYSLSAASANYWVIRNVADYAPDEEVKPAEETGDDPAKLTKAELIDKLTAAGVADIPANATKAELIAAHEQFIGP
jgi:hypothetical protein